MRGSPPIDHLVFASRDLAEGTRHVESLLGVAPSPGGRHEGLGTKNLLVGLGPDAYLEVVGVDPDQPTPSRPRWFGLDDLDGARLVTWATRATAPEAAVGIARSVGVDLGAVIAGSRRRDDGSELRWTFTDPLADRMGGIVPFFIDWGETEHPGVRLPAECRVVGVRAEHPRADEVRRVLDRLGVALPVSDGPDPRIVATIESPNGVVELA